MPAKHGCPQYAGRSVVRESNEPAATGWLDSHLRHGGNPHSRGDHRENGCKLAAFEDHVRHNPRFLACRDRAVAKAVTLLQQQKTALSWYVLELDDFSPGERMRLRNHEKERLLEKLDRKQVHALKRKGRDDQVYTTRMQLLKKHRRRVLYYVYRDAGMLARESAKHSRQKVGATVGMAPIEISPLSFPLISRISVFASEISRRIRSAFGRNALPNSVSRADLDNRSNSFAPSSASSFNICWESEGWATRSASAARVKVPLRATEQKYRTW